jgi:glycerol-3-phosphate dehydrogenase
MAVQLDDVIFRRTGLGTLGHPGRACVNRCATIMGDALGWTNPSEQIAKTTALFLLDGDDDDETT